ncbi:MAG: signal peptide peptidase SppA [Prochlorothrix sp.]
MRDFFKNVFATVLGLFLFMGLSVGGLLVLIIALASTVQREEEVVALDEESLLVYDLSTLVTDRPLPSSFFEFSFSDFEDLSALSLRSLRQALDTAATDDNIVGLYLIGNNFPPNVGGYAALSEIRAAIQDFQETSGKPVWAYGVGWSEPEYYLVSGADALWINPFGDLSFNGFGTEIQFYAGALEKYGIGMQVIRVGKYKAAVEPFTEQKFSAASREQSLALINDLWQTLVATVAEGRELEPSKVRSQAQERGILLPQEAEAAGFVDALKYGDEVEAELRSLMGLEDSTAEIPAISLANYALKVETGQIGEQPVESDNRIALVYAEGEVVSGTGGQGVIASEEYTALLRELRLDESVKAVVLRINSPGGSATAAALIGREVELLKEVKPVMVSMGDVAASGGYWMAAPADRIFAEANTITGSIGVFGLLPNFQQFANNNGVTWDAVTTGPYANLETVARPKTEAELALFQRSVNEIYREFINLVATGRSLPQAEVEAVAQGRVWSGTAAQKVKLVDEIGGLEAAIAAAAAAAELGEDWTVDEYPVQPSLEEAVLDQLFSDVSMGAAPNQSRSPRAKTQAANKSGADKSGADKSGADKSGADKSSANQPGANPTGANQTSANSPELEAPFRFPFQAVMNPEIWGQGENFGTIGGLQPSPSALIATKLLPHLSSGAVPNAAFPNAAFPNAAFPTGAFPTGAVPTGVFPTYAFPNAAFPTAYFPTAPGTQLNPALADLVQDLGHDWHLLTQLNDPRHAYSRLPYRFDLR